MLPYEELALNLFYADDLVLFAYLYSTELHMA